MYYKTGPSTTLRSTVRCIGSLISSPSFTMGPVPSAVNRPLAMVCRTYQIGNDDPVTSAVPHLSLEPSAKPQHLSYMSAHTCPNSEFGLGVADASSVKRGQPTTQCRTLAGSSRIRFYIEKEIPTFA